MYRKSIYLNVCVCVFICYGNLRENGDDGWKRKRECWPRIPYEIRNQVTWHADSSTF